MSGEWERKLINQVLKKQTNYRVAAETWGISFPFILWHFILSVPLCPIFSVAVLNYSSTLREIHVRFTWIPSTFIMISAEFQMRIAPLFFFFLLYVNLQGKSTHFKQPSLILIWKTVLNTPLPSQIESKPWGMNARRRRGGRTATARRYCVRKRGENES